MNVIGKSLPLKEMIKHLHRKPRKKIELKPRKVEVSIGRNEPCPCGSGKKYKKCCNRS